MTSNTLKKPAIYAYKHIITSQVVFSQSRAMDPKRTLRQLYERISPPRLRKDHWAPLFIVSGLDATKTNALYNVLTTQIHQELPSKEYLDLPKRIRVKEDHQYHVGDSLTKLCIAVTRLANQGKHPELTIQLERPQLFDEISIERRLSWPKNVKNLLEPLPIFRGRVVQIPAVTQDADISTIQNSSSATEIPASPQLP